MTSEQGQPDRSQLVKEIFAEVADLPPDRRAAFVDERCGGDAALRQAVESLLGAIEGAGSFMAGPTIAPAVAQAAAPASSAGSAGLPDPDATARLDGPTGAMKNIGVYRLIQELGEGGFGTVYLAEQERPVRRRVALKLIKLGMDTRAVIARFEAERQALAMMDHPNIAKVFDAGATETGRPYFVMELVQGVPITKFCDSHSYDIDQRVKLFVQVCQAVHHAHQKGVIHRDLKPSNVLVSSTSDGQPVVKVIDFGIAKATAARLTEKTVFTEMRQMIGTPEYMSPEQADVGGGAAVDIDTRSDIYSLGVLLYELLTGVTPFDARDLRSRAFAELQRIIREVDPPRPSTRLSTLDTIGNVAARRATEPAKLSRAVRGELDWIVMKCLEKERARRYESASALVTELQRYLADEPVTAHPPGTWYRARKFGRRHKLLIGTLAAILLALGGGLFVALYGLREARTERDHAIAARTEAEAARNAEAEAREYERETDRFILNMFESIDPEQARGKPVLVRDVLDQATNQIDRSPPSHPVVEGSLRYTFGVAYNSLGVLDRAKAQLERALELYRKVKGDRDKSTANVLNALGQVYLSLGQRADAERVLLQVTSLYRGLYGVDSEQSIAADNTLGELYLQQDRVDDADRLLTEALARAARVGGAESLDAITITSTLSEVRDRQGRYSESETMIRQALLAARKTLGNDHPFTLTLLSNLGEGLRTRGKFDEALPVLREAHLTAGRVFGVDHPDTLTVGNNLGLVLQTVGLLDEAQAVFEDVIARRIRVLGEDHHSTLLARSNYGLVLQAQRKFDAAEATFSDVVERMSRTLGPDNRNTIIAENNIAYLKLQTGDLDSAERIFRQLLPRAQRAFGEDSPPTLSLTLRLANVLSVRERWTEAEPLFEKAYQGAQALGIANAQAGYALGLGVCLVKTGKLERAVPLLLAADNMLQRMPTPDTVARQRVAVALVDSYEKLGKPSEADAWRARAATMRTATQLSAPAGQPSTTSAGASQSPATVPSR